MASRQGLTLALVLSLTCPALVRANWHTADKAQKHNVICQVAAPCPNGWEDGGSVCFKVTDKTGSFAESDQLCKALSADANVSKIESSKQQKAATSACGEENTCWIGLSRVSNDGEWQWQDSTACTKKKVCDSPCYCSWSDQADDKHAVLIDTGSEEDDDEFDNVALLRLIRLGKFGIPSISGLWIIIGICVLVYAHKTRKQLLTDARAGNTVEPPTCCYRYCCGSCAIYYWEGFTAACCISVFLYSCYAWVCWSPSPQPKENGVSVVVGSPVKAEEPAPLTVGNVDTK